MTKSPVVRRTLWRIGAILLFAILAGATYQGVATALERQEFVRPGGLVAVGDHQLHIHCTGSGSPTVVLEAPAAGLSASWAAVQPRVAEVTRVCSYDRSGLGWSERSDAPYDPAAVPRELRSLLQEAHELPPFVIAGHGLGAAFATAFAGLAGNDVAAVILVDPSRAAAVPTDPSALFAAPAALPWLARAGILRAAGTLTSVVPDLPSPARGALRAFLNHPDHLSRTAEEIARWGDAERLAANVPALTIPVTRLTTEEGRAAVAAPEPHAARIAAAILDAARAAAASHGAADAAPAGTAEEISQEGGRGAARTRSR